jgi:1,4-alpha-glucan branching enzyme
MSRRPGMLALMLHSHMPYVEGFGTWPFGEEWLWEAVSCVYLPLLEVLDGAPVTVGLTPVLCDQLEAMNDDAGERYLRFMREIRRPIHAEDAAAFESAGEPELAAAVRGSADDYVRAEEAFEQRGRDLLAAFRSLDRVELWTSAATHAVLPLLATDAGRRLQLATGLASHVRRFGGFAGGLWLPECAYEPGVERELADHGVRAFCVDQTNVHGRGAPEHLEPVATEAGAVAVPIDWQAVELVWNDVEGYPGQDAYRDYHRRTRYDLKPWDNAGRPYDRGAALTLAADHARDFVARAAERLRDGGLLCCAIDTELLGHWWYEGPAWLRVVLEEAERRGVELVPVAEALERVDPVVRPLAASTWGGRKDLSTWDSPAVAELVFTARRAELRTIAAAAMHGEPRTALERAARELLALQSSDWGFMVTRELAGDYPLRRVEAHLASHDEALAALTDSPAVPPARPSVGSAVRTLAPDLDLASLTAP